MYIVFEKLYKNKSIIIKRYYIHKLKINRFILLEWHHKHTRNRLQQIFATVVNLTKPSSTRGPVR